MSNEQHRMEAPPVINAAPRRHVWWLLAALATVAVLVILFLFNPSRYGFYPRCVLYVTTGIYCPGCGALRASHQLAHGHVLAALRCNLLLVLSLPFVAFFLVQRAGCWMKNQPAPPFVLRPGWIMALGIVLVIFTILRNIRVAPFTWLAPP